MDKHFVCRSLLGCAVVCLVASGVRAQIGSPGNHPGYSAEVEPHFVLQWDDQPWWGDDGLGVGLRATLPLLDNGPVSTINNSLAFGFGLDWAHFDDACWGPGPRPDALTDDCSAEDFWLPAVLQWNFFFSELISAFPEIGLGIEHTRWDGRWCGRGRDRFVCNDGNSSDTDLEFLLWLGVRFHVAREFALTLRVGTPSLLIGASFFL